MANRISASKCLRNLLQHASEAVGAQPETVTVARIEKDTRPPRLVYEPGIRTPIATGWLPFRTSIWPMRCDLIAASRTFDANLAVMKNARSMAIQTLAIGKRS